MRNDIWMKGLVVVILLLFVGAGVIPSTVGITKEKTVFMNFTSRGYIQSLINNASDGDTIFIPSGTYYENININKSITLIGEDKTTTIIDGSNNGTVVCVGGWVNISGFTIQNSSGYVDNSDISSGISLGGENNTISGNTITNNCYGISVWNLNNNIINNTITNNNAEGIWICYYCDFNNIINNTITNNSGGITLGWGDYNNIINNTIANNNGWGIFFDSSSGIISGNTIANNKDYGLSLGTSHYINIFNNTITNNCIDLSSSCDNIISNNSFFNTGLDISIICNNSVMNNMVNGKPLVYLYNESDLVIDVDAGQIILISCTNITVQNQEIFNTTVGIIILGSNSCVISGNTIIGNHDNGICLTCNSGYNTIINNTISNNSGGVSLSYADYNNIIDNTIVYNELSGIGLAYYAINNTISGNTILFNDGDGISLGYADNNIIMGNNICFNIAMGIAVWDSHSNIISYNNVGSNRNEGIITHKAGIFLFDSALNIITNNTISFNNESGICLASDFGCSYNTITDNNITNNNNYGICIDYSASSNPVYHNNFINNTINAYGEHTQNIWDNGYPSSGNYWNDYTGTDNNGDGIGDTPYNIPGGSNQDRYPFMEPDGWLKAFHKAFIFGKITNHSSEGDYISFQALKTRIITFNPLSFHKYASGEACIVLKDHRGFIGKRYVFALCEIMIRI